MICEKGFCVMLKGYKEKIVVSIVFICWGCIVCLIDRGIVFVYEGKYIIELIKLWFYY